MRKKREYLEALREQSFSDLEKKVLEVRREIFDFRMLAFSETPPKPHLLKPMKRNIARIKTVLAEKKIGADNDR